jgi:hypothetical protein
MSPSPAPVLDYQSPQTPDMPQRRRAAQTARTSGMVSAGVAFFFLLWWSVLFLGDWGKSPLTRGHDNQTVVAIAGVYALTYLLSGLVAYFGGMKIRTPNPAWEHLIAVVTSVQITFACCMVGLAVIYAIFIPTGYRDTFWICGPFVGIHLLIVWRLLVVIRRIHVL